MDSETAWIGSAGIVLAASIQALGTFLGEAVKADALKKIKFPSMSRWLVYAVIGFGVGFVWHLFWSPQIPSALAYTVVQESADARSVQPVWMRPLLDSLDRDGQARLKGAVKGSRTVVLETSAFDRRAPAFTLKLDRRKVTDLEVSGFAFRKTPAGGNALYQALTLDTSDPGFRVSGLGASSDDTIVLVVRFESKSEPIPPLTVDNIGQFVKLDLWRKQE